MKLSVKKFIVITAFASVIVGLIGCAPTAYYYFSNRGSVSAHQLPSAPIAKKTIPQTLITGHPVSINVPSVGINIPVIDGYYNSKNKEWTLSLDKAQFATPTVLPNNIKGNTFIYGHFRWGVFYTLPKIKAGEEAFITTDNGYQFKYRFYTTYATQPTDSSVLHYEGPPMLTLQTCSGTWYQNRQMYLFSYEGYQKI